MLSVVQWLVDVCFDETGAPRPRVSRNLLASTTGDSPFLAACRSNWCEIVEMLVECGADVNAANYRGVTPLHVAAEGGHANLVVELLAHGARVDAFDLTDALRCMTQQQTTSSTQRTCCCSVVRTWKLRTQTAGHRCTLRRKLATPMLWTVSWRTERTWMQRLLPVRLRCVVRPYTATCASWRHC